MCFISYVQQFLGFSCCEKKFFQVYNSVAFHYSSGRWTFGYQLYELTANWSLIHLFSMVQSRCDRIYSMFGQFKYEEGNCVVKYLSDVFFFLKYLSDFFVINEGSNCVENWRLRIYFVPIFCRKDSFDVKEV